MPDAFILESETPTLRRLVQRLESWGYETSTGDDPARAPDRISQERPDLIVVGPGSAHRCVDLLCLRRDLGGYLLILTDREALADWLGRSRRDDLHVLHLPREEEDLEPTVRKLRRRLDAAPYREDPEQTVLVGESRVMQALVEKLEKAADAEAPALLQGESGTGKELAARILHERGPRSGKAYVALNCGAVPENLMESELFGHEKGAFTGATSRHEGVFERAHGGTLFLDEILETPLEMQVKLLRVLETGRLRRVGGEETVPTDVRIVTATNRDPGAAVERGEFRQDLLFRLAVLPLELPPLRDRGEDVVLLARHFLGRFNADNGTRKRLGDGALERLRRYHWPGNVRQLRNVVHRGYILEGSVLELGVLDRIHGDDNGGPLVPAPGEGGGPGGPRVEIPLGMPLEQAEKRLILATLELFDGHRERTAEALGVSVKTLYNRIRRYREEGEDI